MAKPDKTFVAEWPIVAALAVLALIVAVAYLVY